MRGRRDGGVVLRSFALAVTLEAPTYQGEKEGVRIFVHRRSHSLLPLPYPIIEIRSDVQRTYLTHTRARARLFFTLQDIIEFDIVYKYPYMFL